MKIQTLKSLSLTPYWNGVRPHQLDSVQGKLDGACGIYALLNAVVLGGFISMAKLDKLWNTRPNGKTKLGRWQKSCGPLLLHGTNHEDLTSLLTALAPFLKPKSGVRLVEVIRSREKPTRGESANQNDLDYVSDHLESTQSPLLLGLRGPQFAHWVVATGTLTHEREKATKIDQILTVDSSEAVPGLHAWNGALGHGHQKDQYLRYMTISDKSGTPCWIDEAWALQETNTPLRKRQKFGEL